MDGVVFAKRRPAKHVVADVFLGFLVRVFADLFGSEFGPRYGRKKAGAPAVRLRSIIPGRATMRVGFFGWMNKGTARPGLLPIAFFNGSFSLGGRWYGPWWQCVPSEVRSGLLIDGSRTTEEDYRCCHLRLLFALAGDELGDRDAYEGFDYPRREIKLAIQVMLNAGSPKSAQAALRDHLVLDYGSTANDRAKLLVEAVENGFPLLSLYWNTGCGLRLQKIDAGICTNVQRRLRQIGVVCLSVHDSFIVPRVRAEQLRCVMDEELEIACRLIRD